MQQPFGGREFLLALVVFAIAAGARVGYILSCVPDLQQPPPFCVQDAQTEITLAVGEDPLSDRDKLVQNIRESNSLSGPAPYAVKDEITAHVSPGYPYLVGYTVSWIGDAVLARKVIIWTQCALGAVTALLYFLLMRLTYGSAFVGLLAGLLAALHPFWIVNVAELQDGTLASFLVACCLFLGTAAAQRGSPFASFLFGGSLAGMALVRAALLPFSFIACCYVLLNFRRQPLGWLCALLVFLGFGNGLAPWTVRNYQAYGEIVPISDAMFLHMWQGNNAFATGGPEDELALRESLMPPRLQAVQAEPNQALRYRKLADDVLHSVDENPAGTLEKRLRAGLSFIFGNDWLLKGKLAREVPQPDLPAWITTTLHVALPALLLVMLTCGLLGWRWSCGWNHASNLASLAMVWIPLPYILSHADALSGPRLPLDGILLCYTAFFLAWLLPPVARVVLPKSDGP